MTAKIPTIPCGVTLITDLPIGDLAGPLLRLEYANPETGVYRRSALDIAQLGATPETYKTTERLFWGVSIQRLCGKVGTKAVRDFYDELCRWNADPKS